MGTTLAKTFEGDINIQENVHREETTDKKINIQENVLGEETTDKKMKSWDLSNVTALAFEQANWDVCKGSLKVHQ